MEYILQEFQPEEAEGQNNIWFSDKNTSQSSQIL